MLVSVIIPFYSGVDWLLEALHSVFNQSYKNYEVVLINDGSDENLDEVLMVYSNKIKYKRILNSGPGIARNIGIEMAEGKYLAFLDSDDVWFENKLEVQMNFMAENNLKWSHTSYETFLSKTGKTISEISLKGVKGNLFNNFLLSCPLATPCVILKKSLLVNFNFQFSPDMRYGQDYFLWLNIASIEEIGVVDQVLTKVRIRGENTSKKAYNQLYAKAKINDYIEKKEGSHLNAKIPKHIKIIFKMSALGLKIIDKVSDKNEIISKAIYVPIYLYTKLLKRIWNEK